jgi:hypothetical protein
MICLRNQVIKILFMRQVPRQLVAARVEVGSVDSKEVCFVIVEDLMGIRWFGVLQSLGCILSIK